MPMQQRSSTAAAAPQSNDGVETPFAPEALHAYAVALLTAVGAREDLARDTASVLLDGDLMGHTTHGLALLPGYLQALEDGSMRKDGEPTTTGASAAAQT